MAKIEWIGIYSYNLSSETLHYLQGPPCTCICLSIMSRVVE